jgi:hypothetical protein
MDDWADVAANKVKLELSAYSSDHHLIIAEALRKVRAEALKEAAKVLDPVITSGGVTLPDGTRRPMTAIEIELQNSNNRRKAAAIRALGEK